MMEEPSANPFLVTLFFIARCLVPLLVMLGISYLLRRLGLIAEPPPPPPEYDNGDNDQNNANNGEGGLAHGQS
jgi:hypothetical protein